MLTSKQRSYLKSLANKVEPIIQIGKTGITENLIKQVDEALEARELIKITVLSNALEEGKTFAEEITVKTNSEVVQVVGKKITIYRKAKKPVIVIP